MQKPVVSGGSVVSKVILVGQAPGIHEPALARPFAWTAGRTLFGWFAQHCGIDEATFRSRIYMAAVCRCFPGRNPQGGDRVPDSEEIANCSGWLQREIELLRPALILPVGKLAIGQFLAFNTLTDVIGQTFRITAFRRSIDIIPLPHPSGASPWHRVQPGKQLLEGALQLIRTHSAFVALSGKAVPPDVIKQPVKFDPLQLP